MPVSPVLKPRQVIRAFQNLGWEVARQRGSHIIMTKLGAITTLSIPNHPEVARGTLRGLIQKSGHTIEPKNGSSSAVFRSGP
jgi:predicted RNA binding protein YcfA (HicA-like mRNA interferase family)